MFKRFWNRYFVQSGVDESGGDVIYIRSRFAFVFVLYMLCPIILITYNIYLLTIFIVIDRLYKNGFRYFFRDYKRILNNDSLIREYLYYHSISKIKQYEESNE